MYCSELKNKGCSKRALSGVNAKNSENETEAQLTTRTHKFNKLRSLQTPHCIVAPCTRRHRMHSRTQQVSWQTALDNHIACRSTGETPCRACSVLVTATVTTIQTSSALRKRSHAIYPSPTKTQGGVRRTWPPHFILAMASPRAADSTVPVTERSLFRIFYNKHLQTRLHYRLFVCLPTKDTMEGLTTFSKHDDRKDACCPANSISFCLSPSPMYLFVLAILSELNPTDLAEMRAGPTNV